MRPSYVTLNFLVNTLEKKKMAKLILVIYFTQYIQNITIPM